MLKDILLILHVAAGTTALISGLIAATSKIFDLSHTWHVYSGRVFFGAMCAIVLTALPLALLTGNLFLFLIALFSFYLVSGGWRYARNRKGAPQRLDWLRVYSMLVIAASMLLYGVHLLMASNTTGIIMLVFSVLGGRLSLNEIKSLRSGGAKGKERIAQHLTMMMGGLNAAITAFVVVNVRLESHYGFVVWLTPALIMIPIIILLRRRILGGMVPMGMPQRDT